MDALPTYLVYPIIKHPHSLALIIKPALSEHTSKKMKQFPS
jgi:hypothetical protein